MNVSLQKLSTARGALLGLVVLAAVAMLARLGFWQLARGHEKQALIDGYEQAMKATPTLLNRVSGARPPDRWTPVIIRGRYECDRQLLLDNQSQAEQAGYDVWTPLRSDDGALVIVDRGWIPRQPHPAPASPPPAPAEVRGLWRALPVPGLRLNADNCSPQGWPRIVEYPTAEDLRCLYGEVPLAGIVLLAPDANDGFVREWHPSPGFPPERHYAYALQWFALSLTLLI